MLALCEKDLKMLTFIRCKKKQTKKTNKPKKKTGCAILKLVLIWTLVYMVEFFVITQTL